MTYPEWGPGLVKPLGPQSGRFLASWFLDRKLSEGYLFLGGSVLGRPLLRVQGSLGQLVQNLGKVPAGDAPPTLGSVSVETIQETGEILIFADINGEVSQLVSNC